jgi:uncharacterized protein (DUF2267 family)
MEKEAAGFKPSSPGVQARPGVGRFELGGVPGMARDINPERHEARANATFKKFVHDLCAQGNFNEQQAVRAAASVLVRLEQRIMGEEALNLEAQLPQRLQEILAEAQRPREGAPVFKFTREDFVKTVGSDLGVNEGNAEAIIRAVFTTVRAHITEGEAEDVGAQLPKDLQPLWARPI